MGLLDPLSPPEEILLKVQGPLAWITFNRPQALNSLTLPMVKALDAALTQWTDNPSIQAVIVQGEGDRAFCSGGNLRGVYEGLLKNDAKGVQEFFSSEYAFNKHLRAFPKPYISFLNGITMGGGLGASVHGQFRIVTPSSLLAMPETNLGYFPDVGGAYFLNRCPGYLGFYIALTGLHFKGEDALYAGIATHYMRPEKWREALKSIQKEQNLTSSRIQEILEDASDPAPLSRFEEHQDLINRCFHQETLPDILKALAAESSSFAQEALQLIQKKSPTSLWVTFEYLKRARNMTFEEVIQMDAHLGNKFIPLPDFKEGIRAAVIEKDRQPRWHPARLEDVNIPQIKSFFEL